MGAAPGLLLASFSRTFKKSQVPSIFQYACENVSRSCVFLREKRGFEKVGGVMRYIASYTYRHEKEKAPHRREGLGRFKLRALGRNHCAVFMRRIFGAGSGYNQR
jgi:hypothetical protein